MTKQRQKWTPGPWKIDGGTNQEGDLFIWPDRPGEFGGHAIAKIYGEHAYRTLPNARLMVKAPDMAEALRETLAAITLAGVYGGAKDAGLVDKNGKWPLHNKIAAVLREAGVEL